MPEFIFLIGPRAAGKTSCGTALAATLQLPFIDLDERLQGEAGQSVAEIVAAEGWPGFRQREALLLRHLVGADQPKLAAPEAGPETGPKAAPEAGPEAGPETGPKAAPETGPENNSAAAKAACGPGFQAVVACGGGVVLAEANRQLLRAHGLVFYLQAGAEVLAARLAAAPLAAQRPPLGGGTWPGPLEEMRAVLKERQNLYLQSAHRIIDAARPLAEVTAEIASIVRA